MTVDAPPADPLVRALQNLARLRVFIDEGGTGVDSAKPGLTEARAALAELTAHLSADGERAERLEQEQAGRAVAEASERRLGFLYEAMNRIFAGPLERNTRLTELARLTVPDLADWCVIDEVVDGQQLQRLAISHWDPGQLALAEALPGRYPTSGDPRADPITLAIASGTLQLVTDASTLGATHALLHGLPTEKMTPTSFAVLPLMSGGRAVGVIRLVFAESGRRYLNEDVPLLEDLGRLAAVALDNARLYENARRAARAREDLLAVVSHDLQNPLHVILMSTGMLTRAVTENPERALEKAQVIRRSAERMTGLIRILLDAASIEAGRLTVTPELTDVDALLKDVWQLHQPLTEAKGQTFTLEGPGRGSMAPLDRARTLQVLSNLIGNAVKFTPEGGTIRLRAELNERGTHFAVSDTGPGIPPEQVAHVFDRYWQARETARQGTGLGLYIAHGIVQAHHGHIWLESRVGLGTTFHFVLPRR